MITTLYGCVFHGAPDQIAGVRSEVRQYLDGCPVSDDVVLIASELATNAIRHSDSKGAFFQVWCEVFPGYVWVEVEDLGGQWNLRPRDVTRPHGLDIVAALAGENWGVETTSDGDRIVWARITLGASGASDSHGGAVLGGCNARDG
jgi:anti-sigma regulatory factor (Ser/Thr protein kinase)